MATSSLVDEEVARRAFISSTTSVLAPPHVPELKLHLADEAHDLWLKTEEELGVIGLPPPFWAFAWAGGQGLARHILDRPASILGKRVLDFATGSGLVAIAACKAGAASVEAVDIDPWAITAAAMNANVNGVAFTSRCLNAIGQDDSWDVVLAGDIFYDRDLTEAVLPWFNSLSRRGADILVGDPGRSYCPKERLKALATYSVPVLASLEDSEVKRTTVWQFLPDLYR